MRTSRWVALGAAIVSVAAILPVSVLSLSPAHADPPDVHNPGSPGQTELDTSDGSGLTGWPQSTEKVAGRPFVTAFSVGGTSKLSNTPVSPSTTPSWVDGWRVTVAPYNLCRTGQTPETDGCYASPNRISVTVTYDITGNNYFNFAGSTLTGASISPAVTTDTEVDLTLDLNSFGSHLGWTWLNGEPTYWNVTGNVMHIKGKFRYMPSSAGLTPADGACTAIPVSDCSWDQAQAELLTFTMIISVDTTNDTFNHLLFASEGAIIASLETVGTYAPYDPEHPELGDYRTTNALAYGAASAHRFASDFPTAETGGAARSGVFYAVIPSSMLTAGFGVTEEQLADPTFDLTSYLGVTRSHDLTAASGVDAVTWTSVAADTFGTDGRLLKVSNITFSAPKFRMKRTATVRKRHNASASKVRSNLSIPRPNSKQRISVSIASGSKSICRALGSSGQIRGLKVGTCRYTVKLYKRRGNVLLAKQTGVLLVTP